MLTGIKLVQNTHYSLIQCWYRNSLVFRKKTNVNNFVALRLWRLGARDIRELPLLATSSKIETALLAGQT